MVVKRRPMDFHSIVKELPKGLSVEKIISFTLGYKKGFDSVDCGDGITWEQMASSKLGFTKFIRRAAGRNTSSPEYKELYRFLLKCFTDADVDNDGKIELSEFSSMIDAAATAPRKWGFAPSTQELYGGGESGYEVKVITSRTKMFEVMSRGGSYITFDVWLSFCYDHICKKVQEMEYEGVTVVPQIERSKEDFRALILGATSNTHSREYKELYDFLLVCFIKADINRDGKVGPSEFDALIDLGSEAPRRFGFAPSPTTIYGPDPHKKRVARTEMLQSMDSDNDGTISFNEWLDFAYAHIFEKAKGL